MSIWEKCQSQNEIAHIDLTTTYISCMNKWNLATVLLSSTEFVIDKFRRSVIVTYLSAYTQPESNVHHGQGVWNTVLPCGWTLEIQICSHDEHQWRYVCAYVSWAFNEYVQCCSSSSNILVCEGSKDWFKDYRKSNKILPTLCHESEKYYCKTKECPELEHSELITYIVRKAPSRQRIGSASRIISRAVSIMLDKDLCLFMLKNLFVWRC